MQDLRRLGIGLLLSAGVLNGLNGCGIDHVVGVGDAGSGSNMAGIAGRTSGDAGAGRGARGGAAGVGGTARGGTGASSAARGGGDGGSVSGTGGVAGSAGSGPLGGGAGSTGNAARGGDAGGITQAGDGGSGGVTAGAGGSRAEGGAAGDAAGAGGTGHVTDCGSTTVSGTLTDSTGTQASASFRSSAVLVSIDRDQTDPYSAEFVLRTPDDTEWHYDFTLPCIYFGGLPAGEPPRSVDVGDTVELTFVAAPMSDGQSVVVSKDGELLIFTVDEGETAPPAAPDLGVADVALEVGDPSSSVARIECGDAATENGYPLIVTQGSDESRVEAGQTFVSDNYSFTVEYLFYVTNSESCDPPGRSRYGGFQLAL